MLSLAKVCGNDHLPLGQGKLGRTLSLLPIPNRVHHSRKGGVADLLLQKGGPVVEMDLSSVTDVKDMVISQRTAPLRTSIR